MVLFCSVAPSAQEQDPLQHPVNPHELLRPDVRPGMNAPVGNPVVVRTPGQQPHVVGQQGARSQQHWTCLASDDDAGTEEWTGGEGNERKGWRGGEELQGLHLENRDFKTGLTE